jgi:RHS repeat-associated protein
LVVSREFEPVDPDQGLWGRLVSRTTPGGQVERLEYWGAVEKASLPGVCGVDRVLPQWGQLKQVTRQDGSVHQVWRDERGLVAATQVRAGSSTQTTCLSYDVAGDMVRREVFGAGGRLIERTVVDTAVGGKPWVVRSTVTHGPAAPVSPGTSVSQTTTYDMAGRPVRHVDGFGTVTVTTYTAQGSPKQVVITAPASATGAGRTMTLGFDYTGKQNWLQQVTVNGVVAASVAYDENRAQVRSVAYAQGTITADYDYFGNGAANQLTLTTPSSTWVHEVELTAAGRITGSTLTVTGDKSISETRGYQYDDEARLVGAQITSTRGGQASTVDWGYSYGPQDSSCGTGYAAGDDALRTGGSRDGVAYVTCHDAAGRLVSSTDPLLGGPAAITHDDMGRVTRITTPGPDTRLTWGADSQLAVLADAGTTTTLNTYAGQIHTKTLTTPTTTTTLGYSYSALVEPMDLGSDDDQGVAQRRNGERDLAAALALSDMPAPSMLLGVAGDGSVSSVAARMVGLPGGAILSMPTGGKAVLQLSDLDGASLVTLPVSMFGDGPVSDLVEKPGASERFGPYGEPLSVPSWSSAAPQRGWQSKAGFETLAGRSSVTLMGARPYHPVLGEFLAVDPLLGTAPNLYSYTTGDPINREDRTGASESLGVLGQWIGIGSVVAGIFGPVGMALGALGAIASLGLQVAGALTQDKPVSAEQWLSIGTTAVAAVAMPIMAFRGLKTLAWFVEKKSQSVGMRQAQISVAAEEAGAVGAAARPAGFSKTQKTGIAAAAFTWLPYGELRQVKFQLQAESHQIYQAGNTRGQRFWRYIL